jgi:hypothetical protein
VGGVQGTCDQHAEYARMWFYLCTAVDHSTKFDLNFMLMEAAYGDIQILYDILLIKTGGYIPSTLNADGVCAYAHFKFIVKK